MSTEENKAVVRQEFEEIFNQGGNLDAAEEIYAPDYVGHEPTFGDIHGVEGAKQFAADFRQAFPDLQTTIEDMVAEGDKVVTRFSSRGTHQGEIEDLGPPTGNQVEVTGITFEQFCFVGTPALLLILIHPSAWKRNSRKFISRKLHTPGPIGPELPGYTPCIGPGPSTCCGAA